MNAPMMTIHAIHVNGGILSPPPPCGGFFWPRSSLLLSFSSNMFFKRLVGRQSITRLPLSQPANFPYNLHHASRFAQIGFQPIFVTPGRVYEPAFPPGCAGNRGCRTVHDRFGERPLAAGTQPQSAQTHRDAT